jgi:hypothetical protein
MVKTAADMFECVSHSANQGQLTPVQQDLDAKPGVVGRRQNAPQTEPPRSLQNRIRGLLTDTPALVQDPVNCRLTNLCR